MRPTAAAKKHRKFDPKKFLSTIDGGRTIEVFPKKQTVFVHGDKADCVKMRLSEPLEMTGRVK